MYTGQNVSQFTNDLKYVMITGLGKACPFIILVQLPSKHSFLQSGLLK